MSTEPPMRIFVEELDGDRTKCHDVARAGRRDPRLSVAVYGGGSFIGAALTKFRMMGANTWRDPFTLPRNIMRRPRKRAYEGGLRRRGAKIFFDTVCSERVGFR